jgi:hypothetical protein
MNFGKLKGEKYTVGQRDFLAFVDENRPLISRAESSTSTDNLATILLDFRPQITKFQGDVPKASKHGISLARLDYTPQATTHGNREFHLKREICFAIRYSLFAIRYCWYGCY